MANGYSIERNKIHVKHWFETRANETVTKY